MIFYLLYESQRLALRLLGVTLSLDCECVGRHFISIAYPLSAMARHATGDLDHHRASLIQNLVGVPDDLCDIIWI